MSTALNETRDANLAAILGESPAIPKWLRTIDTLATRAGDSINPILVKETRQGLKSRQFVVTFSLLLFAAIAWTIAGSLLLMPQIYFLPSASSMLIGYYIVLAVPMLMVVPLAAYRSLEGEIDDGTLELLSVTALSPKQIVLGKIGCAALQMMLYFVALFPCVAYAYTLRGVDLPTLAILMGVLVVFGLSLTVVAIFFAPMARVRSSQVSTLLVVMAILVAGEIASGVLAVYLIQNGNPLTSQQTGFLVISTLLFTGTMALVFVMATAAQLTPESENRSTDIRVTLIVHEAAIVAIATYSSALGFEFALPTVWFLTSHMIVTWVTCSALMSAEASTMTPRIRRELPSTFFSRLLLVWFTPGPATGYVFALTNLSVVLLVLYNIFDNTMDLPGATRRATGGISRSTIRMALILLVAYLSIALVGVRFIIAILRIRNSVRVGVGMAAMAVILLLMALVPYSIGLHWNDYRPYEYSNWQVTNWVWTIERTITSNLPTSAAQIIMFLGVVCFAGHLVLMGRTVLPQRLLTPKRVLEERLRTTASHGNADLVDPLAMPITVETAS